MANEDKLLDFNFNGVLTHLISAEEHAIGSNDIGINSWCVQKHIKHLASGHHLWEAIQVSEKSNPKLSKDLADFKKRLDSEKELSASTIRDYRNEFRELIGEKSLGCKDSLCKLDRSSSSNIEDKEDIDVEIVNDEEDSSSGLKVLLAVGGVFALITLIGIIKK